MAKIELERKEVVAKEIEVLSCPFCDSESLEIVNNAGIWGYTPPESYVLCKNCGAQGGKAIDNSHKLNKLEREMIAVNKWNRRARNGRI